MLDIRQIMEILPRRAPFLLIDRIDELEPGKYARGRKAVTYDEPYFAGHFPQEPVMPVKRRSVRHWRRPVQWPFFPWRRIRKTGAFRWNFQGKISPESGAGRFADP